MPPTITRKPRATLQTAEQTETWQLPAGGVATVPALHSPDDFDDDQSDDETAVDRLAVLLSSAAAADRASLKIYKLIDGKLSFCASYSPEQFEDGDFSLVRDNYGGGEFELRLYGVHPGSGKFAVMRKLRMNIAEPLKNAPMLQSTNNNQNDTALMFQNMMQFQVEQNRAVIESIQALAQKPQVDPMQQMRDQLGLMSLMREAMGLNNQTQQKSSIGEIVDAIKELQGAASIVTGKAEEPEDDTMKMLGSITELVKAGMTAPKPPQIPQQFAPVQIPQTLQQNPIEQNPQPQPEGNEEMNPLAAISLKINFNKLVTMAKENKPPENGAELIYEKMPDEIVDIMETSEWFEVLTQFAPEVAAHKDWFTKARDLALTLLNEPEEPEEPGESIPGVDNAS